MKKTKLTSKQVYRTPIITVEELEKYDVLTDSENLDVNSNSLNSYNDLFTSIFEDLTGS